MSDQVEMKMSAREAASRVFTASVQDDDDEMLARRREAAAELSAALAPMSELLGVERESPRFGPMIERMRLQDCADRAVQLARDGRRSLFLTPDVAQVARALQRAAMVPHAPEDKSDKLELLVMMQLRQCRDVFELLRVVTAVDARANEGQLALIVTGPSARFFSAFGTPSGLTVAGDGLLRALQLALKRLRRTTGAAVCMLAPDIEDARAEVEPGYSSTGLL